MSRQYCPACGNWRGSTTFHDDGRCGICHDVETMTDKPTDEIERRAEEACLKQQPSANPDDEGKLITVGYDHIPYFLLGHSAAKEEVESLTTAGRMLEIKINALEAENEKLRAHFDNCHAEKIVTLKLKLDALNEQYRQAMLDHAKVALENAELKKEVRVLREHNKELDEWNFTHRVKVESLKTSQKVIEQENEDLKRKLNERT